MRKRAGGLTYRELAAKVNYSAAALSTAASGRALPSLEVTLAYVRGCGGDADHWRDRWRTLAAELAAPDPGDAPGPGSPPDPGGDEADAQAAPYVGLAAFQAEDADRFFGREEAVEELLGLVAERRFTGVFGASGSGKSSVLRAGLVARAGRPGNGGDGAQPVALFTPGPRPMEECAVALAGVLGVPATVLRAEFAADPGNLHLRVREALADRPAGTDLVVVVDQFEEVFTLCADESERAWLIDALVGASAARTSRVRVVLGVRADFYGHCGRHRALVEALRGGQMLLGPMGSEQLRQAITRPAARAGAMVETALVARLVADAAGQPAVLPLVSHALLETWRRRSGATLTLAAYEATGGMQYAIARTAERLYTALTPARQEIARRLFLRLTALGEGTEDTKRRIHHRELDSGDPDTAAVVELLARARLLTVDRDTVEITHEALIRCWPRLSEWLNADREGLRTHRRLTEATEAWEAHDRDPDALYRGARLETAHDWATAHQGALTGRERRFLAESLAAQARDQSSARRRARRLRRLVALLSVMLLVATGATGFAVRAQRAAAKERNVAVARKALSDAAGIRAADPALSLQLGLAAHRLAPLAETRDNLLSAFAAPFAGRLIGHSNTEIFLAFAPGARVMATVSWDRTVRLWDVADVGRPSRLTSLPLAEALMGVAFGRDGRTLATIGESSTRLWDVSDPRRLLPLAVLPRGTRAVSASVAFSPDGRLLAVADGGASVRLFDVGDPRRPRELAALTGRARHQGVVAFSPDGRVLATADGAAVRLWDITHPRGPAGLGVLTGHTAAVSAVAFSPDGRTAATASWDHDVRLWDISTPGRPRGSAVLTGHTTAAMSVAFSPDGRMLASSGGGTILRDVSDRRHPTTITTVPGGRSSVAFSPDGATLAAADEDKTVQLQRLRALPLVGHGDVVPAVAFHPGARLLATGSWDGTARLWDVADPAARHPLATLPGTTGSVRSVIFSPDRRTLATAGDDGVVRLWDISAPHAPRHVTTITPRTGQVTSVAFSADGRRLAAGGHHSVTLWDVADRADPRRLARLDGYPGAVWSVLFSPDGRMLITGSTGGPRQTRFWSLQDVRRPRELDFAFGRTDAVAARSFSPDGHTLATLNERDKSVRLLDVADVRRPRLLATLGGHGGTVWMMAFSPDGRRLATAGGDKTVRLWDITDRRRPRHVGTFTGHTGDVAAVAFSPDGHTLATGGLDHTARLWETDTHRIAARICGLAYPRITRPQWRQYFPGLRYRPPCPT
ncbi:WD40 repeat domain-containing protein [Actinomadura rubrisoli]|uniref:WD40 repeat domain-containing protein n=1 Tax=Actinomadura rubrisoli TaxID=2530368 RepID=UPI001A9F34FA|nr:WD40 repeat domain-containing protein [Actinomadura rubrisoli]